jgi:ribonucleotide monophosphatase NagD (HAD superfamily)
VLISDIAGANLHGWSSVLVRTGVYNDADGEPAHMPSVIADDVEIGVRWAIERSMKGGA